VITAKDAKTRLSRVLAFVVLFPHERRRTREGFYRKVKKGIDVDAVCSFVFVGEKRQTLKAPKRGWGYVL
jgi:hypothetical protein